MKLYHATDKTDLEYLDSAKSKNDNDFGIGLYLTSNIKQAIDWSVKGDKCTGAVYESEIDMDNIPLKVLEYGEEEFKELCYLCRNRTELLANEFIDDFENADIIYGRMLGSLSEFKRCMSSFHGENFPLLSNKDKIKSVNDNVKCDILTFEDLKKRMKLFGDKKNDQYCFKSKEAIEFVNKGIKKIYYIKNGEKKIESEQLLEYDEKLNKIKYI